jgi:hypothetical protein
MRKLWLLIFAVAAYYGWQHVNRVTVSAESAPAGYQMTVLEPYGGVFRVLGRKNYNTGTEAQFSPMDLALGWDKMADPQVYQHVKISQNNRWYYWQVDQFPIPRHEIETQSANTHIIPATVAVAKQLDRVKEGDLIRLKGELVEIKGEDGWSWRSSLSRDDTGQGACEVMRVTQVDWLES